MRASRRLTAVFSLSLSVAAPMLSAGDLAGSVRTVDGRALPQVVLILDGPSGARTIVTGPEGQYRVTGLIPGDYHVRPETPGFVISPEARIAVDHGYGEAEHLTSSMPGPMQGRKVEVLRSYHPSA